MKRSIVLGAGGFIGSHLVERLKSEGYWVRGVDKKLPEFSASSADDFVLGDLREKLVVRKVIDHDFDEIYQLAADMGGAGYIFTGVNDASIMYNSSVINLNVLKQCTRINVDKIFYSSSACVYPSCNQMDPESPVCTESSVYPADPDSEYGWEKLFSERLYLSYMRNYDIQVRIARLHNVYGPEGVWEGGREKAPAAISRKVAQAQDGGIVEIWGDGKQSRSFLYIEDCIDGIRALMESDFTGPVNIGSEERISIADFTNLVIKISGKDLSIKNIPGPQGVRGRTSDNRLIFEKIGWKPKYNLEQGVVLTYDWIYHQVTTEQASTWKKLVS